MKSDWGRFNSGVLDVNGQPRAIALLYQLQHEILRKKAPRAWFKRKHSKKK